MYISLSELFIVKVNNYNKTKTWLKDIEFAESEFYTSKLVICKFIVVHTNIK